MPREPLRVSGELTMLRGEISMLRHGLAYDPTRGNAMYTSFFAVALRTIAVTAVLALFANGASAQIYQCTTPKGQTTFSDRPCGPDVKSLEPQNAPRAAPAATHKQKAPHAHTPPFFGMTMERYDLCVAYGATVMRTQRARPDSSAHTDAYDRWEDACGFKVMLSLAQEHGFNLMTAPMSPLAWSEQP